MKQDKKTIHQALKDLGVPIGTHYSNLYVEVTPETKKIIDDYEFKYQVRTFYSEKDVKVMFYIPLASDDYKR